jgi:hypothetical protein
MTTPDVWATETDRLFELLNSYHLGPNQLEAGFVEFSEESKNEVVSRIARTYEPAPQGNLLARLIFILTDANKSDMTTAFLANLRSPTPGARKASLYGLEKLEHPGIVDFALNSLRDDADEVLVAACDILVRKAKEQPQIWELLKSFYAAHRGREEFYGITSFLEAHGIKTTEPSQ